MKKPGYNNCRVRKLRLSDGRLVKCRRWWRSESEGWRVEIATEFGRYTTDNVKGAFALVRESLAYRNARRFAGVDQ